MKHYPGDKITLKHELTDLVSGLTVAAGVQMEVVRHERESTVILKYKDTYVTLESKYLN